MRTLLSLILLISSPLLLAQNTFDLSDLEPGQVLLNLSVTEQTEVDQDQLIAYLAYTVQGKDKNALQNEVNEAMEEALALLDGSENEALEYATQQYHVYIVQPGRSSRSDIEDPVWRAQQSLSITSKDSAAVLELTGQLQTLGLNVTNLSYSLAPETEQSIQQSLLTAALEQLQQRADEAAQAMNKAGATLVEVNLQDSQNYRYQARGEAMMSMAADSAVQPPVAEPGKSTVSLTVSARALLSP